MSLSLRGERKGPKERHQRAGRPLDTRLGFMGLFDRGDTRARIEKHLRGTGGDTFLSAPKLNPRWARLRFTLAIVSAARKGERVTPCRWEGSRRSRVYGKEAEVNRSEKQSTFPPSRAANRAVVTLTAVRHHGKLRLDSALAILPTGKMAR